MLTHVYRIDQKNVGDIWSAPHKFFDFPGMQAQFDIISIEETPHSPGVVILGGGGLGREKFVPFLDKLLHPERQYKVIAWGVGADSVTRKRQVLAEPTDMDRLVRYFDACDEIGTRIHYDIGYPFAEKTRWVPCASCMSKEFDTLRSRKPRAAVGLYEHRREPIAPHVSGWPRFLARALTKYPIASNRGNDLRQKLEYLAQFETIVTNSYHGVYWSILLGRKCVCVPFKNGLYSFRHAPSYMTDGRLDDAIDRAKKYPTALEECRDANISFHAEMTAKYLTG